MSTEESAQRVWDAGKPLQGPVIQAYYAWRGLAVPKTNNLRFVVRLRHKSGGFYPAIIARAESASGVMTGAQRTFLAQDGSGKAPVDKKLQKMSLGVIKGSMVRLAEPIDGAPLIIGEGVETVATAMQATGWAGFASLGTSGLSGAELPAGVKDVILLGENDCGKSAKAIAKVAPELKKKGIRVRVAMPLAGFKDHNSMVMEAAPADRPAAFEAVRKTLVEAGDFIDPLDDLVESAKQNPGAPFEPETLKLLADLRRDDPSRFEQLRAQLKKETNCRVTELDKRLNQLGGDGGDDRSPSEVLVSLATVPGTEFFHTDLDDGFAVVDVGTHRETL